MSEPGGRAPPLAPGLVLVIAVAAMSWAGPLTRLATAPALAIAAWRLTFSVVFILAVMAARRTPVPSLNAREWRIATASGILLAAHFWSWIASLELTTVASSVVLVSTQPIFVALLSIALLDERPTALQWVGIGLAVGGAAVIGWGDFGAGRRALVGDLLAVAGAVFASGYYVAGRRLRRRLDLWPYILVVYGIAAAVLFLGAALHPAVRLSGHPPADWWIFLALAAGPMMLGHTGINYALRYVPAYLANLAVLGEPVGATLIAWLLPVIGERPTLQVLWGGALILAGIGLGASARRRA